MHEIMIKEMLEKDISRNINGVVKAENSREETTVTELSEYVVTDEVGKYMRRLLDRYADSLNSPTEEMGIWISGFFGSGKSHLLKMLGHIFENKEHGGKRTSQYFSEKIDDAILQGNLEKASEKSTDVIIFNIDNVSDQDTYQNKDAIAVAFLKKFNEYLGFSRDDIKTASFERRLWKHGRFEEFKNLFLEATGESWEESRRNIHFIADDFLEVIEDMDIDGFSSDAAERWLENDLVESISAESFSDLLKEYLEIKGKEHRIIFLVDEVGQYIGDNSNLMLNLQTVTEEIGKKFEGRIWVGVTSQQDIGAIIEDNEAKRYDYSKIQGRFKTMISLSSGNIDEVIKKRLLAKKEIEREDLENYYEQKRVDISNLISFDKKGSTLKLYDDRKDFAETYPFVGYQFNLLQTVFEKVRNMGHSGKHMSRGERSLLSSFQEAGIRMGDKMVGSLVPFNFFFESIEQFLEDNARRPFIHAKTEKRCEDFDVEVLKLLFLLKGVEGILPNLNNLTSFMIDSIQCDRIELEAKIKKSLKKLEKEGLIQRDGELYYFLTNLESDIIDEIKQEEVEMAAVYKELNSQIFDDIYDKTTVTVDETKNKYLFNRYIDEFSFGRAGGQLDIRIFTPNAEDYGKEMIVGSREGYDLIIRLPEDRSEYLDEIKLSLKIESYIKKKNDPNTREAVRQILESKQRENLGRKRRIREELGRAFEQADIFISGHRTEIKTKDAEKVIDEALKASANHRFSKAKLVVKKYDEKMIRDVLLSTFEGVNQLFSIKKDRDKNSNVVALMEMENRIKLQEKRGYTTTLKDLVEYFSQQPYGWDTLSINGLVAELWVYKTIELEESKVRITDSKEAAGKLTKTQSKNLEKIVIKLKEEIDTELINKVNNLIKEIWNSETGITAENPKDELFEIIRKKHSEAKGYKYDCEKNGYPGKKALSEWIDILGEIQLIGGKAEKVLKELLKMAEDIEDASDDVSAVFDFFKTAKKNKFDAGKSKVEEIRKYRDYIGEVQRTHAYNSLVKILEMAKPYQEIRKIDGLIAEIEVHESKVIQGESGKLKSMAEHQKDRFEKIVSDGELLKRVVGKLDSFIDEVERLKTTEVFYREKRLNNIMEECEKSYKQLIKDEIKTYENKALAALEGKDKTEELRNKIQETFKLLAGKVNNNKIEEINDILKTAEIDRNEFINEAEGKSKKKARVSVRRVTPQTKHNLQTEDEVKVYMEKVRAQLNEMEAQMLEAIKENKIVDVK